MEDPANSQQGEEVEKVEQHDDLPPDATSEYQVQKEDGGEEVAEQHPEQVQIPAEEHIDVEGEDPEMKDGVQVEGVEEEEIDVGIEHHPQNGDEGVILEADKVDAGEYEVFDENGEIVEYEDVVVYDDGVQQVVEQEYVDYGDMDENGQGEDYAYMITDQDGSSRIVSAEELRELHASGAIDLTKAAQKDVADELVMEGDVMGHHEDEVVENQPGPSSSKQPIAKKNVVGMPSAVPQQNIYKSRSSNLAPLAPSTDHYAGMSLLADETMDMNDFEDALPSYLREKFVQCLSKTTVDGAATKREPPPSNLREMIEKGLGGQGTSSSRDPEEGYIYVKQYVDEHGRLIEDTIEEEEAIGHKPPTRSHLQELAKIDIEKRRADKLAQRAGGAAGGVGGDVGGIDVGGDQSMDSSYNEGHEHDESMESIERSGGSGKVPYFPRGIRKDGETAKRRRLTHPTNSMAQIRDTTSLSELKAPDVRHLIQPSQKEFEAMTGVGKSAIAPLRYNCPECELGVSSLERLCAHLSSMHDTPTQVRQIEFYSEQNFENFMNKIERDGCSAEEELSRRDKKFSKHGSSQFFKCNFMSKERTRYPEMAEIDLSAVEDVEETCPAFVVKFHSYESVRVKYCDYHLHFDGVVDFRVPILAKRRIFELLYKRLPIPVMQEIISRESDSLSVPGSKTQIRLKNITAQETSAILSSIHGSLKQSHLQEMRNAQQQQDAAALDASYEVVAERDGDADGEGVREGERAEAPKTTIGEEEKSTTLDKESKQNESKHEMIEEDIDVENVEDEGPSTAPVLEAMVEKNDGKMGREGAHRGRSLEHQRQHDEVEEQYETRLQHPSGRDAMTLDEIYLYDPSNDRDVLVDELTPDELRALEIYEANCDIELNEEQKSNRLRIKLKFLVDTISQNFMNLDSATHALMPAEHRKGTLEELKHFATATLEIVCGIEAEINCAVTMTNNVEAMKRNLISSVSSKERRYTQSVKMGVGRRKTNHQLLAERVALESGLTQEEIYERVAAMGPPQRIMGINPSGTFEMNAPDGNATSVAQQPPRGETQQPRAVHPWYPRTRKRANPDADAPSTSDPSSSNSSAAAATAAPATLDGARAPPKRRARRRNGEAEKKRNSGNANVPVVEAQTPTAAATPTPDDNMMANAMEMGVDHEIEISTDEQPEASGMEVLAAAATASVSQEVKSEEETRVMMAAMEAEEAKVKTTRTGRVVKQRKWMD